MISLIHSARAYFQNRKQLLEQRRDFIKGLCEDAKSIQHDDINSQNIDSLNKLTMLTLSDSRTIEIRTRMAIIPGPVPVFTEVHGGSYTTTFGVQRLKHAECWDILYALNGKIQYSKYP